MAFRTDIGSLKKPERLSDGRLRADAHLTRAGVFDYRDASGKIRREYRPEHEVFKTDSLQTFTDAIVTDDHPAVMVTAANARQFAVGQLSGAPRQDGSHVAATLVINDAATIAKMDAGKVQLSCGYEVDVLEQPGVSPSGERYDAIQTNIRGNHVALVDVGRAGPTACVRMDGASDMVAECDRKADGMTVEEIQKAVAEAVTTRLDAMPPAFAAAAKKKAAEGDDEDEGDDEKPAFLKKKLAKADSLIETLTGERDSARNALAVALAARTDAATVLPELVKARVSLEQTAARALGADFKADAADRDLMVAVIKRVDGDDVPADKSVEYVTARYEGAAKRVTGGTAALVALRTTPVPGRVDANEIDEDAAARRMSERSDSAWRTPEEN